LIKTWRASGPSAPCWSIQACFAANKAWAQWRAFIGFRGCKGLQPSKVRKDHWVFDQDLEGVRSLGAVLVDTSFVFAATRHGAKCWAFIGFRGCEGPQPSKVRKDHWIFDQDLEGVRSLGAVLVDTSLFCREQGMGPMAGLYGFRGCKGLQPSRSLSERY
jgi:hypothetical protein